MSSSGSDSGDEDYVPSDCSQPPSEVESDGDEEDSDACDDNTVKNSSKSKKKGKCRRAENDDPSSEPSEKKNDDKEDKQKSESLWSDFLKDVSSDGVGPKEDSTSQKNQEKPQKKRITEVYEFAGEKVTVSKEVTEEAPCKVRKISPKFDEDTGSDGKKAEENETVEELKTNDTNVNESKMPAGCGSKNTALGLSDKSRVIMKSGMRSGASGLSSALEKLGKKNKLSTLEKSKLDWDNFKSKAGINEELLAHNKGKSGFLDRRDFMEAADLKQYELEKQMRNSLRRKL